MKKLKFILTILSFIAAIVITAWIVQDNNTEIQVTLLGFSLGILPLGFWLLVFFIAGLLGGMIISFPTIFSLKLRAKRNAKMLQKYQLERMRAQHQSNDGNL